jgi:hypothetical protein
VTLYFVAHGPINAQLSYAPIFLIIYRAIHHQQKNKLVKLGWLSQGFAQKAFPSPWDHFKREGIIGPWEKKTFDDP